MGHATRQESQMTTKQDQSVREASADTGAALDTIERVVRRRPRESVRTLVTLLAHPNAEVRLRSAEALGGTQAGKIAPPLLIRTLETDEDELVRAEAADSLGLIRDQRAAAALRRALSDRSRFVRAYAASALSELGNRRDAAFIRRRLPIERRPEVRVGLLSALYSLGDDAALAKLLGLIGHSDYHVRSAVSNALASLRLKEKDRSVALKALQEAASREKATAATSSITNALRCLGDRQSGKRRVQ